MANEIQGGAGLAVLAFFFTYAVHGTVLAGLSWLALRTRAVRAAATEDVLWKAVLVGPLLTAALQLGLGLRPFGGGWQLGQGTPPSRAAAPAARTGLGELRIVPLPFRADGGEEPGVPRVRGEQGDRQDAVEHGDDHGRPPPRPRIAARLPRPASCARKPLVGEAQMMGGHVAGHG